MKLWRLCVHDPEVGVANLHYSSKREAMRASSRLIRQAKEEERPDFHICSLSPVEVPTTREALVKWLNQNAVVQDGQGDQWAEA